MNNMKFCILSALGILFVVAGHIGYGAYSFGSLFQYYSFHMPLFIFISGYFYNAAASESNIFKFIKHKFIKLLIPYFIWNLIYGIIVTFLHKHGFSVGGGISFHNLIIEPFISGHQFMYNSPAWFVPALFIIQILNLLLRKLLFINEKREYFYLLLCFVIGFIGIKLGQVGYNQGYLLPVVRTMYLLPCFELGQIYKVKWEKTEKNTLFYNTVYFTIILLTQSVMLVKYGTLITSAVWCNQFNNGPIVAYISVITGIGFWLKVSGVLADYFEGNKFLTYLGRNTFPIMMHHLLVFMFVNLFFFMFYKNSIWALDFNVESFKSGITYWYLPYGEYEFKLIYILLGILLPLLFHYLGEKTFNYMKSKVNILKTFRV